MTEVSIQFRISDDGFSYEMGDGGTLQIGWDEIATISVEHIRLPGLQEAWTALAFDNENGDFVEISEGTEGFDELLSALETRFSLSEDWRGSLTATGSEASVVLWERPW